MIITYPNPILTKVTEEIADPNTPKIRALISEMLEALKKHNGLGIAAPQIGQSLRLCIIKLDGKTHILVNPKITKKSWRKIIGEEGCLSFPGIFVPVKRAARVTVKAQDEKGSPIILKGEDLLARAFQHEIDHLDGITIEERKLK